MFVWRICATKHQKSAFSGVGGLYVPGRWHPQGHKIVYTAESLALASLEIFVHKDKRSRFFNSNQGMAAK